MSDCWLTGHDWRLNVTLKANGVRHVTTQCRKCRQRHGVKFDDLRRRGIDPESLPIDRSYLGDAGTCSVAECHRVDVEWHHFAPRSVFGFVADDWPVMTLCKEHHMTWHQAMNNYQWNGKA